MHKRGVVVVIFAAILLGLGGYLKSTRFAYGTNINGIDCSWLTPRKAKSKIERSILDNLDFTIATSDGETVIYKPSKEQADELEIKVDEGVLLEETLQNIMNEQKGDTERRNFSVEMSYNVNEGRLREYVESFKEFNEGTYVEAQNAHVYLEGDTVKIAEEVYGYDVNMQAIFEMAIAFLEQGNLHVDLTNATKVVPEILSDDEALLRNKEEIEKILNTSIEIQFGDGEAVILDNKTTSNWIVLDEVRGIFCIERGKIVGFVDQLARKLEETKENITFSATEIGTVIVPTEKTEVFLNKEAELSIISELLYTGETYTLVPIYNSKYVKDFTDCYIELDIARQKLWMYKDGDCILETSCVTGNTSKKHDTPVGVYFLTYKTMNKTLTDRRTYWSFVKYWMPFNKGIGFHDASWREKNNTEEFGEEIYLTNGSHGCVNLPTWAAKVLYQNIDVNIPIIIYNSDESK